MTRHSPDQASSESTEAQSFVVAASPGSLMGALLMGLIEQRFPESVCSTVGDRTGDANVARVLNTANGNSLLVFAAPPEPRVMRELAAEGSTSAIDLGADREEIECALQALQAGAAYFSAALTPDQSVSQSIAGLTRREREVAELVTQGLANAEIAALLGVSAHTVRTHLQAIYGRLGVRTRGKLAAKVRELKP